VSHSRPPPGRELMTAKERKGADARVREAGAVMSQGGWGRCGVIYV
jgi:hypothetical protein